MSLFESLGNQQQQQMTPQQAQQMQQARAEFDKNYVQILRNCGFSIPDGMTNPQQITDYLFRSQLGRNGKRIMR